MKPIKPARPKLTIHRETLRKLSKDDLSRVAGGAATRTCTVTYDDCPPPHTSDCPPDTGVPYTHVDNGNGACLTNGTDGNG